MLATALFLASQVGDGGCAPPPDSGALPGACRVDTEGIRVEEGAVVDVLTVRCDPSPVTHAIKGWLEHRHPGDQDYAQLNPTLWITTVPDAEGFSFRVESRPCVAGQWKAVWRTKGTGPLPLAEEFDVTDSDYWPTEISKEDCWGWS